MQFKGKRVLVFGTGSSGISASRLLLAKAAKVILYDQNDQVDTDRLRQQLGGNEAVSILLGELSDEVVETLDLLVVSPGVPLDLPVIKRIEAAQIPIWGEVELAYACSAGQVLAITGTNGKTTTTALLGEIMKAWRQEVYVVGNIGNPYTDIALDATDEGIMVAELSSFQLESIHSFHPQVSAILNIAPDHLDRHHTMAAYIAAKERVVANQTENDVCVLNYEDEVLRDFAIGLKPQVLFFSSAHKLDSGMYLDRGFITYNDGEEQVLCHVDELKLLGTHNFENVMAASLMAIAYGVPLQIIKECIREFSGVAHRIEFVREHEGVRYYNDSKGTNPDAAIKGIQAMKGPTLLIGGGYDKQADYSEWIKSFDGKVKQLILVGATKERIAAAAKEQGFTAIRFADSLAEAVAFSTELAEPGDAVLLSPACASWGMFKNYEERGDKFKEMVNSL